MDGIDENALFRIRSVHLSLGGCPRLPGTVEVTIAGSVSDVAVVVSSARIMAHASPTKGRQSPSKAASVADMAGIPCQSTEKLDDEVPAQSSTARDGNRTAATAATAIGDSAGATAARALPFTIPPTDKQHTGESEILGKTDRPSGCP